MKPGESWWLDHKVQGDWIMTSYFWSSSSRSSGRLSSQQIMSLLACNKTAPCSWKGSLVCHFLASNTHLFCDANGHNEMIQNGSRGPFLIWDNPIRHDDFQLSNHFSFNIHSYKHSPYSLPRDTVIPVKWKIRKISWKDNTYLNCLSSWKIESSIWWGSC